jgi:hypothetical protein
MKILCSVLTEKLWPLIPEMFTTSLDRKGKRKPVSLYIKQYFPILKIIFLLFSCWVRVNSDIYKGYYNVSDISYLNSPPPPLSFIPPFP